MIPQSSADYRVKGNLFHSFVVVNTAWVCTNAVVSFLNNKRKKKQNNEVRIFFKYSHPYLPCSFIFFLTMISVTVWLAFSFIKKVSGHPSHVLEQLYKHPSFNYTWSYKKKKIKLNWTRSRWLYAGISTVQKWQPFKKKKKEKKIYYRSWQTKTVLSA